MTEAIQRRPGVPQPSRERARNPTWARDELILAVLDAHRAARQAVFDAPAHELNETAREVQSRARLLGSKGFVKLQPGLEPAGAGSSTALMLHDELIPLTSHGLGSRRLTSLSVQEHAIDGGAILAIDEVEAGLEPHRLAHLLRHLNREVAAGHLQVIMTTHSPVAVQTLPASHLAVVKSEQGTTTAQVVDGALDDVQGTVRAGASALLGKRVLVGEGKTEVGFLGRLLEHWDEDRDDIEQLTSVTAGVVVTDGSGDHQAAKRASVYATLGYPTALLCDQDTTADVSPAIDSGVTVVRAQPNNAIEDDVVAALDEVGLDELVALAIEIRGADSIRAQLESRLPGVDLSRLVPSEWITAGADAALVRQTIGATAKGGSGKDSKKSWFKTEDGGYRLASIVVSRGAADQLSALAVGLNTLRTFAYVDASITSAEQETANDVEQ